jgi:adenylate cyclase
VEDDAAGWATLGLYDPDACFADDRLATLRYLTERGATTDDLQAGVAAGNLPSVMAELARRRPGATLDELADRHGVSLPQARQLLRAAGLGDPAPDDASFVDADVDTFRLGAAAVELFGLESTLQTTRVIGASLANIADAAVTNFGQTVGADGAPPGRELALAEAAELANTLLYEAVPAVLGALFVHHADAASRRALVTGSAETSDLTVGFLDLVGSTGLAERLSAGGLGRAISGFERDATEQLTACDGRVVKTIGDEVMFVGTDAAQACHVALDLAAQVADDAVLPRLRGALAAGPLVRGYGDYYGPIVTTAARAVKLAEPGDVLVTAEVRRRAESPALAFESVGEHRLRGFDQPVALFRVQRP